jgi:hypothetical protein
MREPIGVRPLAVLLGGFIAVVEERARNLGLERVINCVI